jgi:FkbM family methyltransferase
VITTILKKAAAGLPLRYQQELKRLHFARMIRKGTFTSAEAHDTEFDRLREWVSPGDWVVDVGANLGNYSARMSELVGDRGRVFSFEPVPETFELLTANMARLPLRNLTLLNLAASDERAVRGMAVPRMSDGAENRYMAHLTEDLDAGLAVACLPVDALDLPRRVSLIKIDVEGHELAALRGMRRLLERDRPVLIVEGRSDDVAAFLAAIGYRFEQTNFSPNRVFLPIA